MRYLVGFVLLLLALGPLRMVGCGDAPEEPEPPECLIDEDCDDQNECTADVCGGGVCFPLEKWYLNGTPCERNGFVGICLMGLGCTEERECWADEHCEDDQNECTYEFCDAGEYLYECGVSTYPMQCEPCEPNGGGPGICKGGVCKEAECVTGADCDDGIACTDNSCDCGRCQNPITNCDDDNPCTEDSCDPVAGCNHTAYPDGTECGCLDWGGDCRPPWLSCIGVCVPCHCTRHAYCQNGECV